MSIWHVAATGTALAGYALLSWLLMSRWPEQPLSVALLFGPLLAGLLGAGLLRRHGPSLLGGLLLAGALAWVLWQGQVSVNLLYVLQHGAIHLMLLWGFGLSLRPGATPLITLLAEQVHEHFPPAQRRYTRGLTQVWAGYFGAMLLASATLYLAAPWDWWTVFCNLFTPASAVALFVGEYLLRYRLHPEFERVSMARALQAYRRLGQPAPGKPDAP